VNNGIPTTNLIRILSIARERFVEHAHAEWPFLRLA
jgi:hypothetical protein